MKSLIIDCSAGMNIYVIDGENTIFKIDNTQKKHTDELLLCVDELLSKSNLTINEIENLCVCVGPGSFTGIRVAISICKGLAVDSKVKIYVASNFDIYELGEEKKQCLVLEGFSKFVYVRQINNGKIIDECMCIDDCASMLKSGKYTVYVQNKKVQDLLNNYEICSKIAQNNTILHFKEKIKNKNYIELNQISPVYLRASQAEIERNAKLSGDK